MFFSTPSPIAEAAPEVAQKRAIVRAISAHSPAQRHKKAAYRAFFAQYAAFFYLTGILHALTSLRSKASQSSAAHGGIKCKSVLPGGVYVRQNTLRPASVEFVCLRHTNYARGRMQAFSKPNQIGIQRSDSYSERSSNAADEVCRLRRDEGCEVCCDEKPA